LKEQEGVSERARHRRHRRELHATGGSETMGQYNGSERSGQPCMRRRGLTSEFQKEHAKLNANFSTCEARKKRI